MGPKKHVHVNGGREMLHGSLTGVAGTLAASEREGKIGLEWNEGECEERDCVTALAVACERMRSPTHRNISSSDPTSAATGALIPSPLHTSLSLSSLNTKDTSQA